MQVLTIYKCHSDVKLELLAEICGFTLTASLSARCSETVTQRRRDECKI